MKIYCIRPITGNSYAAVHAYYRKIVEFLSGLGYEVLHPTCGKNYLRTESVLKSHGYDMPQSTNHAIFNRDRWMVRRADISYADLTGIKKVSIGSVMEMAIAKDRGKHVVLAMEEGNVHTHAFVLEAADIVFRTTKEALDYLDDLAKGTIGEEV